MVQLGRKMVVLSLHNQIFMGNNKKMELCDRSPDSTFQESNVQIFVLVILDMVFHKNLMV